MSKSTKIVPASADEVRAFARAKGMEGKFTAEVTRGRLPKSAVEAFEAETGKTYVAGFKPEATVTLKVTKVDAKGRKRTRSVEKSLAEVRALAGEAAGARGILGKGAIAAAEAALSEVPASE